MLKLYHSTLKKKLCIIKGDGPLWQRVMFYHSPVWAVPAPLYRQLAASMHHLLLCCGIKPAQSRCSSVRLRLSPIVYMQHYREAT